MNLSIGDIFFDRSKKIVYYVRRLDGLNVEYIILNPEENYKRQEVVDLALFENFFNKAIWTHQKPE
jgi:hypothetical protein